MELVQGQKLELTKLTEAKQIEVERSLEAPAQTEVDVSCFGLDGAKKLSDDRYFIFYNQKTSPCGALKLEPQGEGRGRFSVVQSAEHKDPRVVLPGTFFVQT